MIYEMLSLWIGIPLGILIWRLALLGGIRINYNDKRN
jgi:hypothetical protein